MDCGTIILVPHESLFVIGEDSDSLRHRRLCRGVTHQVVFYAPWKASSLCCEDLLGSTSASSRVPPGLSLTTVLGAVVVVASEPLGSMFHCARYPPFRQLIIRYS